MYYKYTDQELFDYIQILTEPPLRPEWDFTYKLDRKTARVLNQLIKRYKVAKEKSNDYDKLLERYNKLVSCHLLYEEMTGIDLLS